MALTRALTQAEIDFIVKAKEEGLPNRTIAEKLGRSLRAVQKYAKQYSDTKTEVAKKVIELPSTSKPPRFNDKKRQNTIERLIETREVLRVQMLTAEPRNIAQITKEYRATLAQIEELEKLEQPQLEGSSKRAAKQAEQAFKLIAK